MRVARSLPLVACLVAACGGGSSADGTTDADDTTTDAPDVDAAPQANTFTVTTPDVVIDAGDEVTYCYYFDMPNTTDVAVRRWASEMTPGSHHLILYFTDAANAPAAGTLTANCDSQGIADRWTYSSQLVSNEATMPAGVAMGVKANQRAYIQLHYLNAGDGPLTAHAELTADLVPDGESYVPAAAYVTYGAQFTVPSQQALTVEHSCEVPGDAHFFGLTTHSHARSTMTAVYDGADELLTSDNWEHPPVIAWDDPFYTFTSGELTYHCEFFNGTDAAISEGSSAEFNEMCMAVGYFFPAAEPVLCVNSFIVP